MMKKNNNLFALNGEFRSKRFKILIMFKTFKMFCAIYNFFFKLGFILKNLFVNRQIIKETKYIYYYVFLTNNLFKKTTIAKLSKKIIIIIIQIKKIIKAKIFKKK